MLPVLLERGSPPASTLTPERNSGWGVRRPQDWIRGYPRGRRFGGAGAEEENRGGGEVVLRFAGVAVTEFLPLQVAETALVDAGVTEMGAARGPPCLRPPGVQPVGGHRDRPRPPPSRSCCYC